MKGWYNQSHRHYLAAKGISTKKYYGSMRFKKYTNNHKLRLQNLYDKNELEGPGESADTAKALAGKIPLRLNELNTKMVTKEGELVGTVRVRAPKDENYTHALGSVFIIPSKRGEGLGKEVVENVFKDPNIKVISGLAEPGAKGFWSKQGAVFGESDEKGQILFTISRKNYEVNK